MMPSWHTGCSGIIRMKNELTREIIKFAQHYLNGLRISPFLIRHGFDKMKVKQCVCAYESLVYPFIYNSRWRIQWPGYVPLITFGLILRQKRRPELKVKLFIQPVAGLHYFGERFNGSKLLA